MSHLIHLATQPPRFIKGGIHHAPRRHEPTTPFHWPLGPLGDLAPRVLAAHEGERPSVELGYERAPEQLVPVLAANDGQVSLALEGGGGYAVSLDHSGTWSTHYTGLSKLAVVRCLPRRRLRQSVRAGDVIGYNDEQARVRAVVLDRRSWVRPRRSAVAPRVLGRRPREDEATSKKAA